jgi:hypothetical protein
LTKDAFFFGPSHPIISSKGDLETVGAKARRTLAEHHAPTKEANDGQSMEKKREVWDRDDQGEAERVDNLFGSADLINKHLSMSRL